MTDHSTPVDPPVTGTSRINIGKGERIVSIAGAWLLLTSGLNHISKRPAAAFIEALAGGYLLYRGATGHCPINEAIKRNRIAPKQPKPLLVREAFTVNRSRSEVYNYWRRLENLPLFMKHLVEVHTMTDQLSHWEMLLPAQAGTIEWDAEIVEDKPEALLSWRSTAGSDRA